MVFKILLFLCVGIYIVCFLRAVFCSDEMSRAHAMVVGSVSAFLAILALFGTLATQG